MTTFNPNSAEEITGQFAMIRFDCDICENTRTSDELSVELRGQLISGGTDAIKVHVFPKLTGNKLRAKREKLRRYLQASCVQYGDEIFLVKREKVSELLKDCEEIIKEFNSLLMQYYSNYNHLHADHLQSLEGDLYHVASALSYSAQEWFGRNTIGMAPAMLMQGITEEDNERLVDEIASASLKDIRRSVNQIYKDFFVEDGKLKTSTTTKPIHKLKSLSSKVSEVAIVQEGLGNIAGYMREVIASIPVPSDKTPNVIEGHGFSMLLNLIMLLKDEEMLRDCANDARNLPAINADDDWFDVDDSNDTGASSVVTQQNEPENHELFVEADEFNFE